MAGAGAKKRAEENKKRLKTLQIAALVTTAVYAVFRFGVFRSSSQWYHWVGLAGTLLVHGICYWVIAAVARPVYSNGELVDGGGELNKSPPAQYSHDVLYVTAMVQILAAFTDYGWLLYLTIPGYILFQMISKVAVPMFQPAKPEAAIDPALLKKLEKAEKRSERRRMKRF